ncbi:GMC oxidoreductase [Mycobacterium sp.]|jgi:choline dehydrogenase-like flavoprotein|uniref:GMC oxidoreductase n=1 Tax=Mycobacterium sp. TaxID=1785 RepID=UPI0033402C6D|nr:choline dehydrogenase-like flavoprotein [Mycobacterium sp.]
MAAAAGAGITNHMGEVFGYDNLFVIDGSVIPRAIGRNPSKTIAAVAERSCNKLLEEPAASPQWRDGGLARNHARRTVRGVDIRHVLHRVGGVER